MQKNLSYLVLKSVSDQSFTMSYKIIQTKKHSRIPYDIVRVKLTLIIAAILNYGFGTRKNILVLLSERLRQLEKLFKIDKKINMVYSWTLCHSSF